MGKVKILIADDDSEFRVVLKNLLSSDPDIEVAGEATNGMEAVQKVQETHPDLMTIDLAMPVMNGLAAIEKIMATQAIPILVISNTEDADISYVAISKGALELLPKTEVRPENHRDFLQKVKTLAKVKVITHLKVSDWKKKAGQPLEGVKKSGATYDIVAIASSTGGPQALGVIFSKLPRNFPVPIVVAQHIVQGFAEGLAGWLQGVSPLAFTLGREGQKLEPGNVYISPPETHMAIDAERKLTFSPKLPGDIYHPSCNRLLSSVAMIYGARSVGAILTGMGDDGVEGIGKIKNAGGWTIAQNESSSIIYGMPKVATAKGYIQKVLPLEDIGPHLLDLLETREPDE